MGTVSGLGCADSPSLPAHALAPQDGTQSTAFNQRKRCSLQSTVWSCHLKKQCWWLSKSAQITIYHQILTNPQIIQLLLLHKAHKCISVRNQKKQKTNNCDISFTLKKILAKTLTKEALRSKPDSRSPTPNSRWTNVSSKSKITFTNICSTLLLTRDMQPKAFVDSRLFNFTTYISLREQQHIRRLSLFKRQKSSVPNTGTLQFSSYFKM